MKDEDIKPPKHCAVYTRTEIFKQSYDNVLSTTILVRLLMLIEGIEDHTAVGVAVPLHVTNLSSPIHKAQLSQLTLQ